MLVDGLLEGVWGVHTNILIGTPVLLQIGAPFCEESGGAPKKQRSLHQEGCPLKKTKKRSEEVDKC